MNKRVENTIVIDDKEDLEITKIAYKKINYLKKAVFILSVLLTIMIIFSSSLVKVYFKNKNRNYETIEIRSNKHNILITNAPKIDKLLKYDSFEGAKDLTFKSISKIEINTDRNLKEKTNIFLDIRYNILNNGFLRNEYKPNDGDVQVRFSYSYDLEEWIYINNVISTDITTINPLMGNYYDVSGIISNIKVLTNYKIKLKPNEKKVLYWKAETIIKNRRNFDLNSKYTAEFKINYKDNTE